MWIIEMAKGLKNLLKNWLSFEAQQQLLESNGKNAELREEIVKLKNLVEDLRYRVNKREEMIFRAPYYWREADDTPFCPKCWESEEKAVHLTARKEWDEGIRRVCRICRETFWEKEPIRTPKVLSSGGVSRWLDRY